MARGDREREWKIGTVGAQVQNWRTISCGHARIRRNGGGGGGGGTRAAVVPTQDKKGQTMETEGGRESRVRSWWHQLPASRDTLRSHRSRTSLVFASCQARLVSRFFEKRVRERESE